jgi:hypothetical protein
MNLPPSSHELDELASAYLDGEVTADERARVEGDPALLARVGELGQVRETLKAAVTPADAAVRARALEAARQDAALEARPVDLDVRRAERRRNRINLLVLGGAAAAAIAVAVAVATTRSETDSNSSSSATVAAESRDAAEGGGATTTASAPAPATTAAGGATTTTAAAASATTNSAGSDSGTSSGAATSSVSSVPNLGAVDDDATLRRLLNNRALNSPAPSDTASAGTTCAVPSSQLVAAVTWQGTPALVFLGDAAEATVLSVDGCRPLAVVPLG